MKFTPLKKISHKRRKQLIQEAMLTARLLTRQGGKCYDCGTNKPDFRGWQKHELIFRSHGGDPQDESNCIVLCAKCHSARHSIVEK